MARSLVKEKPLFRIGSSKRDFLEFPEAAKERMGAALSAAQFGGMHPGAKPWKGEGPGVFEVFENRDGDTYRAVYTGSFPECRLRIACISEEILDRYQGGPA